MAEEQTLVLAQGEQVRSAAYGIGTVILDGGATAVVRFAHGIEECPKRELELLRGLGEKLASDEWDVPLEVINRVQAEAIGSVNSVWSVFSRSRMELLPHQLWVCRQVNAQWPTRWLVADDVGLGKTIEAGMILWPLLARGAVKRLLVLCPKSLVEQWQYRMRTMFDIRLVQYSTEADTVRSDFWGTHHQVVASFHTLRLDRGGRHDRLFSTQPWDLVLVDEAHHLNADEATGPTEGYRLVRQLAVEKRLVHSMVFFTGTPHRGKDFNFLSLLALLRPDLFDPKRSLTEQLHALPNAMIRNNKANVTDLKGKRLFKQPVVTSETYVYSPEEERFYDLLTQFIASGRAYASGLSVSQGEAVILVLIAMQKLASSSVAAIRRALEGRLARIGEGQRRFEQLAAEYERLSGLGSDDELARLEEELATLSSSIQLMEDEKPALEELLAAARAITEETKIAKLLDVLEDRFAGRPVLFFTEYKATQALLVSGLFARFGLGCAKFINGDDELTSVRMLDGSDRTLKEKRASAAESFNKGEVRFLVSTEAGGEGIDLQENCHTLIHVDLPWNPMRLHQRVGRLNRYGQKERVEVLTFRNPDTVESLIWDRLNSKLERITAALGQVMEEPEDLLQLVLGMTSGRIFTGLFSEGQTVPKRALGNWFDKRSATFGGRDVIETVRNLVGNVSKFDFGEVAPNIPRADLPDLKPFFESALAINGRRAKDTDDGLAFLTPDAWKCDPTVFDEYEGMVFDRTSEAAAKWERLVGVGHKLMDEALKQAVGRSASVASIAADALTSPMVVFRMRDRVTGDVSSRRSFIVGIEQPPESGQLHLLKDWELLQRLNGIPFRKIGLSKASRRSADPDVARELLSRASAHLEASVGELDHGFRIPTSEPLAMLWPMSSGEDAREPLKLNNSADDSH